MLQFDDAVQDGSVDAGGHGVFIRGDVASDFHLAASNALLDGLADQRIGKAKVLVEPERKVKESGVDGTALEGHGSERRGARRDGIAGHAGNGHGLSPVVFGCGRIGSRLRCGGENIVCHHSPNFLTEKETAGIKGGESTVPEDG